jgi:hypothetical protein
MHTQNLGAKKGRVVNTTPWTLYALDGESVSTVQEVGWAVGPVGKSWSPTVSNPGPSNSSESLYRLAIPVAVIQYALKIV